MFPLRTALYGNKPAVQLSVSGGCLSKCPYNKIVLDYSSFTPLIGGSMFMIIIGDLLFSLKIVILHLSNFCVSAHFVANAITCSWSFILVSQFASYSRD